MKFPSFDALRPYTYALLRIGMALMFMQHGAQKLFGALGGFGQMGGSVPIVSKFGLAGIIEFAGGLLIAVGILTRPIAWLAVIEMCAAQATVHLPQGPIPILNHGEQSLSYLLVFLLIATHGPGRFSLDAMLGFDREEPAAASM
jgi:putative oxidoreductase